jgi:hypothetical protein
MKGIIIFCVLFLTAACNYEKKIDAPFAFTELAMQPGMEITATNKNGVVSVVYVDALTRLYQWDDYEERRTLIPRQKRWFGMLGAYDPASAYLWQMFGPRIVAEDSQLNFQTREALNKWLKQSSQFFDWVYNNEGLVVGFAKSPDRKQVNIEVYQLYLNGRKPTVLMGSRPDNLHVTITN